MKELSPEQVARLRPEARERYEKRLAIVKRNRKILKIVCISLAAVAVVLTLSMTVLFNISSISVKGTGTKYSSDQILMASGIDVGDNMVRTNFKKVEERIEKGLPYVLDAKITKTVTGKVTINITDTKAATAVKTSQGYVIADVNGKTLEIVKTLPENSKLMLLKIKGTVTATPGEPFAFNDANEKALYDELMTLLNEVGIASDLTEMDLTNRGSLKLIYQNRLRLLLGSTEKLDEKIKSGAQVIEKENANDKELIAEINLKIAKKAFVNPLESLDPPKEDPDVEVPVINEETTGENGENNGETDSDEDENESDSQQENTEEDNESGEDNSSSETEEN